MVEKGQQEKSGSNGFDKCEQRKAGGFGLDMEQG